MRQQQAFEHGPNDILLVVVEARDSFELKAKVLIWSPSGLSKIWY